MSQTTPPPTRVTLRMLVRVLPNGAYQILGRSPNSPTVAAELMTEMNQKSINPRSEDLWITVDIPMPTFDDPTAPKYTFTVP